MTVAFEPLRRDVRPTRKVIVGNFPARYLSGRIRLPSIDLLRGLVMVLMALDHTRDFFSASGLNLRDVTEPALFLTRWITHFCAPAFIFLAGVSAFLYGAQGRSTGEVSRFLATRGLWLVLIELTAVRFGWTFNIHLNHFGVLVIFAIGASMLALSTLVYLPRPAIAATGLVMIFGHNLLDGIHSAQFGAAAPLWDLLHQPGQFNLAPGVTVRVLYPLVPWVGVMAAGYALGPVFLLDRAARVRRLLMLGGAIVVGFLLLRASNLYGDPAPWSVQNSALATVLSFVDCEKYPPSLLYLGMTLGPSLLLLVALEGVDGSVPRRIATFGRVPFFYYVAHLYLLHILAVLYAWATLGDLSKLATLAGKPPGYGLGQAGVYALWLAVVVLLYPACRWFAALKRRRTEWWWRYL